MNWPVHTTAAISASRRHALERAPAGAVLPPSLDGSCASVADSSIPAEDAMRRAWVRAGTASAIRRSDELMAGDGNARAGLVTRGLPHVERPGVAC
jgi:hypothetical protein